MFSDPLSVTYNSVAKSLPRMEAGRRGSKYRTADGEFGLNISNNVDQKSGMSWATVRLSRVIPDPTPADVFDPYRPIVNAFGITYGFDTASRYQASVDHPLLRTAVLALVDSTFYGRIITGEIQGGVVESADSVTIYGFRGIGPKNRCYLTLRTNAPIRTAGMPFVGVTHTLVPP